MRRVNHQSLIAAMMNGGVPARDLREDAAGEPFGRSDAGAQATTDGRSGQPDTSLRECQASSCANNADGRYCGLTAITVNKVGGCDDYVASAEEDVHDTIDRDTIEGISRSMSTDLSGPINIH